MAAELEPMLSSGSTAHSAVAAEAAEQARKNKLKRQQRQLSLEPDNEGNIGARNIVFSKFDEVEREVLRHPDRCPAHQPRLEARR